MVIIVAAAANSIYNSEDFEEDDYDDNHLQESGTREGKLCKCIFSL